MGAPEESARWLHAVKKRRRRRKKKKTLPGPNRTVRRREGVGDGSKERERDRERENADNMFHFTVVLYFFLVVVPPTVPTGIQMHNSYIVESVKTERKKKYLDSPVTVFFFPPSLFLSLSLLSFFFLKSITNQTKQRTEQQQNQIWSLEKRENTSFICSI